MPDLKNYIIFQRVGCGHATVDFASADTLLNALVQYVRRDPDIVFYDDGSLSFKFGRKTYSYPHVLAYIEAMEKKYGEWQIRQLPDWILSAPFAEGVCGDDWGFINTYFDDCRPHLRKLFPRSQAKGFLWRLKTGTLVTFYRKVSYYQIKILARFHHNWDGNALTIEPYTGTYDDIMESIDLDPGGRLEGVTEI